MDKGKKDTSPYAMANWLQRVLFLYINPLIKIANERLKEGSALKGIYIYIYIIYYILYIYNIYIYI